jgi:hypothetical protein
VRSCFPPSSFSGHNQRISHKNIAQLKTKRISPPKRLPSADAPQNIRLPSNNTGIPIQHFTSYNVLFSGSSSYFFLICSLMKWATPKRGNPKRNTKPIFCQLIQRAKTMMPIKMYARALGFIPFCRLLIRNVFGHYRGNE